MFGRGNFRDCITDNLKSKGYGAKRTKDILEIFERKVKAYDRQGLGHPDADIKAMSDTYNEVAYEYAQKIKRTNHNINIAADIYHRVEQGFQIKTSALVGDRGAGAFSGSQGVGVARGIAGAIQFDPRTKQLDYENVRKSYHDKYIALFGDALDSVSKGSFGVQKGVQHLAAIVDELHGIDTKDVAAREFAQAYKKLQKLMVEDFNNAGGSLRHLVDFMMPQKQSMYKLLKEGKGTWVGHHLEWIDWNKTTWPNGDLIEPEARRGVLEAAYDTMSTGGANKIKTNSLNGHGGSVGNQLEKDRFLVFKGSKEWSAMHEAYGDGNVFDVVMGHVQQMATHTAQVKMFGTSPSTWIKTARAVGEREVAKAQIKAMNAGDKSAKVLEMKSDFETSMRRVEDMFAGAMHQNSMDPNSKLGAVSTMTSNLLNSAQLSGAVVMALPGDMFTAGITKALNGSGFSVGLGTYLKGMVGTENRMRMMARTGFVVDEHISSTYAAERFTGLNTYAAPISRRMSDITLRLSGLNRHTHVARSTSQLETMGMFVEYANTNFDELPFRKVLERYGVNAAEWDQFRKIAPTSPDGGNATFLTPLSILSTEYKNKEELYRKFYTLTHQESLYAVPQSTLEATVVAKGLTRPDTIAGLILHSFAMYKNYPLTFAMQYGRLGLAEPNKMTRIGFYGGLIAGMTLVGAVGTQVRELTKGRTPLPMDDARFWGKSFAAGGAAGIWGDFLFNGTTEYGRGPLQTAAGPLVGFYSDAINMTAGTAFKWADQADRGEEFDANVGARAVEFARRYTPGSSMWWGRLALDREVFDRLQAIADPNARVKQRRKARKQQETYGNTYYWQPGQHLGD